MNAVNRLIVERASQTMSAGGIGAVIGNLTDNKRRTKHFADAKAWVETAIAIVKHSPGGEAVGTDEQIAQTILDGIAERRAKQHPPQERA